MIENCSGYVNLRENGNERQTDKQTIRWTDGRTEKLIDRERGVGRRGWKDSQSEKMGKDGRLKTDRL